MSGAEPHEYELEQNFRSLVRERSTKRSHMFFFPFLFFIVYFLLFLLFIFVGGIYIVESPRSALPHLRHDKDHGAITTTVPQRRQECPRMTMI